MGNYRGFKDENLHFWLENGIIYLDLFAKTLTEEMIDLAINKRLEIFKGEDHVLIADITKIKNFTRGARERIAQKDGGIGVQAVALIVRSKTHKTMFNFFSIVNKPPAPTKMFNDHDSAYKWIKSFI